MWLDTHCHLDAPEFLADLGQIIENAQAVGVQGILLPAVRAHDFGAVKELVHTYKDRIPYLVYTLGIHPLYTDRAKEEDLKILEQAVKESLNDPHFVIMYLFHLFIFNTVSHNQIYVHFPCARCLVPQ